jgi:ABC-type glycerol-3-phosphate transport system permease component
VSTFTQPQELLDAARVDGASEYGVFFRVIVPLAKPALATWQSSSFWKHGTI